MYDESNVPPPEYRIRPVVRYVVTRYCFPYTSKNFPLDPDGTRATLPGSSSVVCEVPTEQAAYEIAQAMASREGPLGGTVQSG